MDYYKKNQDTYFEPETVICDGAVITVHVPHLSDKERQRRLAVIRDAAASLIRAAEGAE